MPALCVGERKSRLCDNWQDLQLLENPIALSPKYCSWHQASMPIGKRMVAFFPFTAHYSVANQPKTQPSDLFLSQSPALRRGSTTGMDSTTSAPYYQVVLQHVCIAARTMSHYRTLSQPKRKRGHSPVSLMLRWAVSSAVGSPGEHVPVPHRARVSRACLVAGRAFQSWATVCAFATGRHIV